MACRPDGRFELGDPVSASRLRGGLQAGHLHEVVAKQEHGVCCIAFGLLMAQRAAPDQTLLWAREDHGERHVGRVYPPGLGELGIDPARLILVRTADTIGLLKAARDAVHCEGIGAVIIESQDNTRTIDLTVTRRLVLAAEHSGVTIVLVRRDVNSGPSAARTRWQVASAYSASFEGDAPGHPAFAIDLLCDRGGTPPFAVQLEWNRDQMAFRQPSFLGDMAAVPAERADRRAA